MHTILYLAIPLIILSIRRIDKSIIMAIKEDSWWVTYALAFSVIPLHLALMYIPAIQYFVFNTIGIYIDIIALDPMDWIICITAALIPLFILETLKWTNRRFGLYY